MYFNIVLPYIQKYAHSCLFPRLQSSSSIALVCIASHRDFNIISKPLKKTISFAVSGNLRIIYFNNKKELLQSQNARVEKQRDRFPRMLIWHAKNYNHSIAYHQWKWNTYFLVHLHSDVILFCSCIFFRIFMRYNVLQH